jgi:hypothetical protein
MDGNGDVVVLDRADFRFQLQIPSGLLVHAPEACSTTLSGKSGGSFQSDCRLVPQRRADRKSKQNRPELPSGRSIP